MTTRQNIKRRSTCIACGKRLSVKTESGDITWQPSQVDDKGLYCDTCYKTIGSAKNKKHPSQNDLDHA